MPGQRPADGRFDDLGELNVFLDRQAGDDAAVFGDKADTSGRGLVRGHLVQCRVVEPDFAMVQLRAVHPGNCPKRCGLAAPLRPSSARISPSCTLKEMSCTM